MYFGSAILENSSLIMKYNEDALNSILKEFSEIDFTAEIVTEAEGNKKKGFEAFKKKVIEMVIAFVQKVQNFVNRINAYLMTAIANSKKVKNKYYKLLGKLVDMEYDWHELEGKFKFKEFDLGINIESVYTDFPKAFDSIFHNFLIEYDNEVSADEIYQSFCDKYPIMKAFNGKNNKMPSVIDKNTVDFEFLRRVFNMELSTMNDITKVSLPALRNAQKQFGGCAKKVFTEADNMISGLSGNEDFVQDKTKLIYHNAEEYIKFLNIMKGFVQTYMDLCFKQVKISWHNIKEALRMAKFASKKNGVEDDFDDFDDFEDEDFEEIK